MPPNNRLIYNDGEYLTDQNTWNTWINRTYTYTIGLNTTRTLTDGNPPMATTLQKEPDIGWDSKLNNLNKDQILFKLSDIRNIIKALRNKQNKFTVRVINSKPLSPREVNTKSYNVIEDMCIYKIEDVLKDFSWLMFDTWTQTWQPVSKDVIPIPIKEIWWKYRNDLKKYEENKNKPLLIETTLVDYLQCIYNRISNARKNQYNAIDREWKNLTSIQLVNTLATKAGLSTNDFLDYRTIIKDIMPIHDNQVFIWRRYFPKNLRYSLRMDHRNFLIWMQNLYYKVTKEPFEENTLYHSNWTHRFEYLHEGIVYLSDAPNDFIPKRLVDQRLFVTCLCCETLHHCHEIYNVSPDARVKEFLLGKLSVRNLAVIPIRATKDQIIESIKVLINKKLGGSDLVEQVVVTRPVVQVWTQGWYAINYSNGKPFEETKKPLYLCTMCYEILYRQGGRGVRLNNFIKQYTANPLTYHPSSKEGYHRLAKGEKPVIEIIKNPNSLYHPGSKEIDKTMYMGIELEVTPSKYIHDILKQSGLSNIDRRAYEAQTFCASIINEFLNKKGIGIMKSDISIINEHISGFEIVSVPGTHRWHMTEAWEGFFKEDYPDNEKDLAPSTFLAGWSNNGENERPSCGIHIHISKAAINQLQLGRLLQFTGDPNNRVFIEDIAGRKESRYAKIVDKKIKQGKALSTDHRILPRFTPGIEREAINLNTNGKPTIEIRIFRSNVAKAGFMKNIDFVHALVTWCNIASNKDIQGTKAVNAFVTWCAHNRGQYKWLTKWLEKKKYINTVHVFNSKYSKEYEEVA